MKKYIYFALAFVITSYQSADAMKPEPFFIKKNALSAAECLGDIALQFRGENFYVLQEGTLQKVSPYDVDATLKNITHDQLKAFIEQGNGYIKLSKMYDGQFKLESRVRGLGGCSSKWFYEDSIDDRLKPLPLTPAIVALSARPIIHHRQPNSATPNQNSASNSPHIEHASGSRAQLVVTSPNTERAHNN